MGEAARRDEKLWNERLSSGSLKSLSNSFYRSFAKAYYSGSLASLAPDDSATSNAFAEKKRLISSCGGGSSNTLSFSDTGKDSILEDDPNVSVCPIPPSKSLDTTKKSIFDLSGRFRHMASCLTSGALITDRPGRTLLHTGANRRLVKPTPPPIVNEGSRKSKVHGSHISPRASVLVSMVPNCRRPLGTTGEATTTGERYDNSSFDTTLAEVNIVEGPGPTTATATGRSSKAKTQQMDKDRVGNLSPHVERSVESSLPELHPSRLKRKDVGTGQSKVSAQSHFYSSCGLNGATRPVEWALATTLASRRHKGDLRQLKEPRQRGRKRGPFVSRKGKEDRMSSVIPRAL